MFSTHLLFADRDFSVLILVGLGLAVGVLAGFFGIGGGWIVTPALNAFGFPMHFAIGTGLASITGQSALASVKHRKMGNVDYTLGAVVGVFMGVGVEGGKRTVFYLRSLGLAESVIRWIYVGLLAALGVYMLYEYFTVFRGGGAAHRAHKADPRRRGLLCRLEWLRIPPVLTLRRAQLRVSLWILGAMGVLVGFLAGLMGAGGGFALVPMFVYLVGAPTYVAVSTSLVCVLISGAYGTFTYALQGSVELTAALWLLVGAVAGAQLGSAAIRHVRGSGLRLLYSLMLLVAAGGVLVKQLAMPRLASVIILGGALAMCAAIVGRMTAAVLGGRRRAQP